jgi:hypothetical protein
MAPRRNRSANTSHYMGKNLNESTVKVRTEGVSGHSIIAAPTEAYTHGNILPLLDITRELRIGEYLAGLVMSGKRDDPRPIIRPHRATPCCASGGHLVRGKFVSFHPP